MGHLKEYTFLLVIKSAQWNGKTGTEGFSSTHLSPVTEDVIDQTQQKKDSEFHFQGDVVNIYDSSCIHTGGRSGFMPVISLKFYVLLPVTQSKSANSYVMSLSLLTILSLKRGSGVHFLLQR